MFNAPDVIAQIPDIAKIYEINDKQCDELDLATERLEKNIFLETMDEEMISRWESVLKITPLDNDTVSERRFRVKSKMLEKLPYTERVIRRKLDALCPNGYTLEMSADRRNAVVKIALTSKKMFEDVDTMLDEVLPLSMTYKVMLLYNQHDLLTRFKHGELTRWTYGDLRESVLEVV